MRPLVNLLEWITIAALVSSIALGIGELVRQIV